MPEGWRDVPRGSDDDPCEHLPPFHYTPDEYVPINQPGGGHGGPSYEPGTWRAWQAACVAQQQDDAGAPIGIVVRNRNCPFPYAVNGNIVDPDSVRFALDALPKLDYLIMALELLDGSSPHLIERNALEIVMMVRTHPNPRIADAFIGNYADSPHLIDEARIFPGQRDRSEWITSDGDHWDRHALYHALFDLAMPVAYPYDVYSRHSDSGLQGGNTTPNDRAAIFWAPLERVSASARDLPQGHRVMPWISNYVDAQSNDDLYHAPPPTEADLIALVQHYRLRGAASFMHWTSDTGQTDHPSIDYAHSLELSMAAWKALDPFFAGSGPVEILNLETDKTSGVQWSAVRKGSQVGILVSNLHETETVRLETPYIGGLPAFTPPVPPGAHRFITYTCTPAVRDFDGDGTVNNRDYSAYTISYYAGLDSAPNPVGGAGGDWRDIDGDGDVNVDDLILVALAYWSDGFADFADDRRGGTDDDGDPLG